MRSLQSKPNVVAPGGSYPYGKIKDRSGATAGTPVNEQVYGDIHQFFERLMAKSGITPNNLPENSTNGFQLFEALQRIIVPIGFIGMWSGSVGSIPTGWGLCDGTNSTPNLSGKFIVGYNSGDSDYNAIGATGGAKTVALTKAQIPKHRHQYTTLEGTTPTEFNADNASGIDFTHQTHDSEDGSNDGVGAGGSGGNGAAHENRPPYYTLAYIMKLPY
jgi:hypothetical protein